MEDIKQQPSAGTEILDGAQNAVIDAVSTVSEMIEKTTAESVFSQKNEHEAFYLEAEFWVGFSFVLVVIVLAKPLFKALKNMLILRRDKIVAQFDEAQKIRDDAQKLYAEYERKSANVDKEVGQIFEKARLEVQAFTDAQTKILDEEFAKRQKEADALILSSKEKNQKEMDADISEKTIALTKQYLKMSLDEQTKSKLIDESIARITQI
ncbi:MAG: hypothetical protein IJS26_05250 [Alphaproteobacteria bacterium]|nr:hypothetical protein [Alphaproteobacteria bacterium]